MPSVTDNHIESLQDFTADKHIESLQNMVADGIMSPSEGKEKIYMIKEKAVLKVHTRAINQRSDGRYITKVESNHTLIQKSADTYKQLIEKLYDFYFGISNATLEMLYPLWVDYRRNETALKEKSIKEYGFLWNAHLQGHPITRKPIRTLTVKDYTAFFRSVTKDRQMTRKRFNNMKSVMNGILFLAIERDIIQHNLLRDINYRQFSYKPENNKVTPYTEEERLMMLDYVPNDDLTALAIRLDFFLTLRIGELKGLRFDDVQGTYIRVQRSVDFEHKIDDDVKSHTSTGFRWLPLTNEGLKIIEKIRELNPDSEYMFKGDGNPFCTCTFNRRLKKYCKALGIKYRPSHQIRFASASILYNNGVTMQELQDMLGHTTLSTTHRYLKNITSREETYAKVQAIYG